MKEFKGTPGPWRLSDEAYTFQHVADDFYHQISAGRGYLNEREGMGFSLSGLMSIHDANLIAAAPELLEALQYLTHALGYGSSMDVAKGEELAEAAINKALGERMKLIDLLIKELAKTSGWPKEAVKAIYFKHKCGVTFYDIDGNSIKTGLSFIDMNIPGVRREEVTKEEFESALAASESWIELGGGECPVDIDAIIGVKYRKPNTYQFNNDRAGDFTWSHYGIDCDIIAYRLHRDINSRANDDRLEQDLNECIGASETREWIGDGVPPIGCACEMQDSKGAWLQVVIIAKNDGFTFGWSYDYRIVLFGDKGDEFLPLRTESEKAREKLAASLHAAAGASPIELNGIGPLYFKLADAIISGSVFGTTFKAGK